MDLPPSSSDDEEAEERSEDEAGCETDGHTEAEHQNAGAAQPDLSTSNSKTQSQNTGFNASPISTAEEGCSSSEAHHNVENQRLSAQQESSEPIAQADDAPGHALHGNLPDAGLVQRMAATALKAVMLDH